MCEHRLFAVEIRTDDLAEVTWHANNGHCPVHQIIPNGEHTFVVYDLVACRGVSKQAMIDLEIDEAYRHNIGPTSPNMP